MTRIVIAGGGLSGLSLAAHLAVTDHRHPVVVVDDGAGALDSRTWASWSDRPGLLDAAASRWFERIRVHVNGRTTVLPLGRYRYRVVRGEDLRSTVRRYTDPSPHFTFRRGQVGRIDQDGVVVDGDRIRARWVFDSVIGSDVPPRTDAHLGFRGWYVGSGVLLDVVTREPAQLERAFGALFRYRTAEPALSFLGEATTPPQEWRLSAGMSAPVYLAAAIRRLSS